MIIDFHTHIFPDSLAPRALGILSSKIGYEPYHAGTADALLASMDNAGIDRSVVLSVVTKPSQTQISNEWLTGLHSVSDRFIPFGALHPQNADYVEQLDYLAAHGVKGIKMHPDYQDFYIDDPAMYPMYNAIFERGMILLVHAGFDIAFKPPFKCPPARLRRLLDNMKDQKLRFGNIVAAHFGGCMMWDEMEQYLAGQDIYLDTSMGLGLYGHERLRRVLKNHGRDKILFGTDSPWFGQAQDVENMRSVGLDANTLHQIFSENARTLLKL